MNTGSRYCEHCETHSSSLCYYAFCSSQCASRINVIFCDRHASIIRNLFMSGLRYNILKSQKRIFSLITYTNIRTYTNEGLYDRDL